MERHRILWRRLDLPGHEASLLSERDGGWELSGSAVFRHEGQDCRLDYTIGCDSAWRTRSARVGGWLGDRSVALEISVDDHVRWQLNAVEQPAVAGCLDIDLNFRPSTNLLPIRRLRLREGQGAAVRAAWLRFPEVTLEPLEQRYQRLDATTFRYESGDGAFQRDLAVAPSGFVTDYPGFFRIETETHGMDSSEPAPRPR